MALLGGRCGLPQSQQALTQKTHLHADGPVAGMRIRGQHGRPRLLMPPPPPQPRSSTAAGDLLSRPEASRTEASARKADPQDRAKPVDEMPIAPSTPEAESPN